MNDPLTEEYYSARAPEYEQIYYRDVPQRRQEIDDQVVRVKKLATGRTVLDLACGTGYWTKVLAETAREVIASDLSPAMLVEARKKEYVCPVEFVRTDMFEHRFDKRFDLVTSGFWFSHQPRQEFDRFFEVLRHPLTEDGLIWLIDNNPPAEGPKVESERVDEHGNNFKKRFLDGGEQYVILKNYFEKQELKDIFAAEFEVLELVYRNCYWSVLLRTKG